MSARLNVMQIFDANVAFGRAAAGFGPYYRSRRELLAGLDEAGTARALVYSMLARETDPLEGNALLREALSDEPRVVLCEVLLPDREPVAETLQGLADRGVKAVRLFPTTGHFSVAPWCIGELAAGLERLGVVLFIDFEGPSWTNDRIDWRGLDELCTACPSLKVVVCNLPMATPANYRPLLARHATLHLELSAMVTPGELARLATDGAIDRLIYGTALPVRHPWAALAHLEFSGLEPEAQAAVAGGNLERLLGLQPTQCGVTAPIFTRDAGAIDTHVHLGGWSRSSAAPGRPDDLIEAMDRCGVERSVVTSLWACFGEVARGNADVAAACRRYPHRISGYLTLDLKHPAEVADQLALHGADPHFRGIKLHEETQGFGIEAGEACGALQFASDHEWPLLVHGRMDGALWRRLCPRYPDAKFILAHVGGAGHDSAEAREFALLARELPNLYFDLASTRNFNGYLPKLVEWAGAEKILYGSDYPLMDFGFELGQVFQLPEPERTLILRGNACRIFGF